MKTSALTDLIYIELKRVHVCMRSLPRPKGEHVLKPEHFPIYQGIKVDFDLLNRELKKTDSETILYIIQYSRVILNSKDPSAYWNSFNYLYGYESDNLAKLALYLAEAVLDLKEKGLAAGCIFKDFYTIVIDNLKPSTSKVILIPHILYLNKILTERLLYKQLHHITDYCLKSEKSIVEFLTDGLYLTRNINKFRKELFQPKLPNTAVESEGTSDTLIEQLLLQVCRSDFAVAAYIDSSIKGLPIRTLDDIVWSDAFFKLCFTSVKTITVPCV